MNLLLAYFACSLIAACLLRAMVAPASDQVSRSADIGVSLVLGLLWPLLIVLAVLEVIAAFRE